MSVLVSLDRHSEAIHGRWTEEIFNFEVFLDLSLSSPQGEKVKVLCFKNC